MEKREGAMENLGVDNSFWRNKKVFITGNTGFKGSWLTLWLSSLGAEITGYSLVPPTNPSLFDECRLDFDINSITGDIRNSEALSIAMKTANPDIVFHLAAQPLVRDSYKNPVETYTTNVIGTVNLFEAVRKCSNIGTVVNVTTDKCYENKEWPWAYRENEPLGGYDPYSSSKACAELVTSAYRSSFFNTEQFAEHGVTIATARAGNVIGGGDWASDRLLPDCFRSLLQGNPIIIRNPHSIRPWQHVLEPLSGYLLLAQKLYENGPKYSGAWNFGPSDHDARTVEWIVKKICEMWGRESTYGVDEGEHPHEATYLKLDCSKAKMELGWTPKWSLEIALEKILDWNKVFQAKGDLKMKCLQQIKEYRFAQE
jgi:CDP-glucose 4,6-dehydratase